MAMHCDKLKIIKVVDGRKIPQADDVIRETEVVIKIDGRVHRRLTCLAEHLEDFALGYLFDEGIVYPDDVDIEVDGNVISVSRKRKSKPRRPSVIASDLQAADFQILAWA
ncbi:MAG: formate dehydrogenase accessory sulfurtransferase FdhD, partial [Dehalococcoidia bacterium]